MQGIITGYLFPDVPHSFKYVFWQYYSTEYAFVNTLPINIFGRWQRNYNRSILDGEIYIGTFTWGCNSKRCLEPVRAQSAGPVIVSKTVFDKGPELSREKSSERIHPKGSPVVSFRGFVSRSKVIDRAGYVMPLNGVMKERNR